MLERLARWCYTRRWLVLILWIVAFIGSGILGSRFAGESANNFGLFFQDEMTFGNHLSVTAGARYDRILYDYKSFINPATNATKDFTQVTPKIGASWLLGQTRSVYANFGGGIEVPAGNETDPYAAQGAVAINPLLEPIKSSTVVAGVKTTSE